MTACSGVLDGMGPIVLHSAHESRPFTRLMGTSCSLRWREADDRELVWLVNPAHTIAAGVPQVIVLPRQEMYGEYFDIPKPDEVVFVSSYTGGEVFRSGCTFTRGLGKIFYFSPGHETYPVYHDIHVQRVLPQVQAFARHSSLMTTLGYVHRIESAEWTAQAAAVSRSVAITPPCTVPSGL